MEPVSCARLKLSRIRDLEPKHAVQRYEHAAPGDLLHLDIKKLGRLVRPSHRVTGDRRDSVDGAGWEYVHVAIDDTRRTPSRPSKNVYEGLIILATSVAATFLKHRTWSQEMGGASFSGP